MLRHQDLADRVQAYAVRQIEGHEFVEWLVGVGGLPAPAAREYVDRLGEALVSSRIRIGG